MTDGFKGSVSKSGIKGNYLYTVKYLIKKKKKKQFWKTEGMLLIFLNKTDCGENQNNFRAGCLGGFFLVF